MLKSALEIFLDRQCVPDSMRFGVRVKAITGCREPSNTHVANLHLTCPPEIAYEIGAKYLPGGTCWALPATDDNVDALLMPMFGFKICKGSVLDNIRQHAVRNDERRVLSQAQSGGRYWIKFSCTDLLAKTLGAVQTRDGNWQIAVDADSVRRLNDLQYTGLEEFIKQIA